MVWFGLVWFGMICKFISLTIRFGWDSPLSVEEEEGGEVEVEQDFFPRYSNPWSQTEWGSKVIRWDQVVLSCHLIIVYTKGLRLEATTWSWTLIQ